MKLWIARDTDLILPNGSILEKGEILLSTNEPILQKDPCKKWWWARCKKDDIAVKIPSIVFPEVTFENSPQQVEIKLIKEA